MISRLTEKHMEKHILKTICFFHNLLPMVRELWRFRHTEKHIVPSPVGIICFSSVSSEDSPTIPEAV